ncbi:MAG: thioredoxin family protein [Chitinophagales bacterium]
MKKILFGLMVMISMNVMAQNAAYNVSKDEKNGELVYNGLITFDDLNKELTFTWLKSGHDEYKPEETATNYLRTHLKDYSMAVFLGTWCDDSHYLIPKFEKILLIVDYPLSRLSMYGVDRAKTTKNGVDKTYNITLVPTIILFKGGKEVGRITETVQKSVEADLAAIIEKDLVTSQSHK